MVQTIIDSKIGTINIFDKDDLNLIQKLDIELVTGVLRAGEHTTLSNFFNSPVVFLGVYQNYLQFEIGKDANLFNTTIWCNAFKKIDKETLLTSYQSGTIRDYRFKNGKWS